MFAVVSMTSSNTSLDAVVPGACTAPVARRLVTTIWKAGHASFAGGSEKFDKPTKRVETWPQSWKALVERIEKAQSLPSLADKREHPHLGLYHSPKGFRSNRPGDVVLRSGLHVDIDEGATDATETRLVEILAGWGLAAIVQRRNVIDPFERKLRAIIPLVPDDARETFHGRAAAFLSALGKTLGCPIDLAPAVWSQPTFLYGPVVGREPPQVVASLAGEALDLHAVPAVAWSRRVSGDTCAEAESLCRAMFEAAGSVFEGDRCTRPPDGDNPSAIDFLPEGGFRCWTAPTHEVRMWLRMNVPDAYAAWWRHPGRRIERARAALRTRDARVARETVSIDELPGLLESAIAGGGRHVFELPAGTDGASVVRGLKPPSEGQRVVAFEDQSGAADWDPARDVARGPCVIETTHTPAFVHHRHIDELVVLHTVRAIETLVLSPSSVDVLRRHVHAEKRRAELKQRRVQNAHDAIVVDLFFAGRLTTIPEWIPAPRAESPLAGWLAAPEDAADAFEVPPELGDRIDAALRRAPDVFENAAAIEAAITRLLRLGGRLQTQTQDDGGLRVVCLPAWTQRSFVLLADAPDPALRDPQLCPDLVWRRCEAPEQRDVVRTWHVLAPDEGDLLPWAALWQAHLSSAAAAAARPLVCVRDDTEAQWLRKHGYQGALLHAEEDVPDLHAHDRVFVLGLPLPLDVFDTGDADGAPRPPAFWRALERDVEHRLRAIEAGLRLHAPRDAGAPTRVEITYVAPSFPAPPWREGACALTA